jgi:protein TonB
MTSNEILKADVLDIIFDNRNKQYGAYALRKNYNFRMGMALGLAFSSTALVFLLINPSHSPALSSAPAKTEYEVLAVQLPEEQPQIETPPPVRPAQQTPAAQQKFINKFRITDSRFVDPGPTHIDLSKTAIGDVTTDGPAVSHIFVAPPNSGPGDGRDIQAPVQPEAPFVVREQAAHFPGGMDAWLDFLRKNLWTPESLEPGEKRTVIIRFQVSPQGEVTGFEVVQSAGSTFDKEVIRVLKKMPKWMPAIQNGHPVSVSFTQPVTFVAQED